MVAFISTYGIICHISHDAMLVWRINNRLQQFRPSLLRAYMGLLVIGFFKWRLPGITCIAIVSCFVSERFLLHFRVNYLAALSLTWAGIYGGVVRKEEVSDIFPPAVCIYVTFFLLAKGPFQDHTRSTAKLRGAVCNCFFCIRLLPSYLLSVFALIGSACRGRMIRRCLIRVLLKMEVVGSSATLTHMYQSTRHRILGHSDLHAA